MLTRLLEAQTGFEPVNTGGADHCLTTWLLRPNDSTVNRTRVTAVKGRCLDRLTMEPYILFDHLLTSATENYNIIYIFILQVFFETFFIFLQFFWLFKWTARKTYLFYSIEFRKTCSTSLRIAISVLSWRPSRTNSTWQIVESFNWLMCLLP